MAPDLVLDLLGEIPRNDEVRAMDRILEHRPERADDGDVVGLRFMRGREHGRRFAIVVPCAARKDCAAPVLLDTSSFAMWKTLLVPHDFSSCASAALDMAAKLARVHGAALVLVHVSDLPPNVPEDAHEEVVHGASRRLEGLAAPLRDDGLTVGTRARIGDVCRQILSLALEEDASAIVMATHGRQGLARAFLGSVAENVVRRSPIPVVTVRVPGPAAEPTAEEIAAQDELAG